MELIRSVCVYCGSQEGSNAVYCEAASVLGSLLARQGIRLVYGGGTRGLMGAISRSVLDEGGEVLGIIPRFLMKHEAEIDVADDPNRLVVTGSMHERKHRMFEEADAFIAMPGGIGTLEELVEIMTWAQLGRHEKPVYLLNSEGFWNPFLDLLKHMSDSGFLHSRSKVRPVPHDAPESLVESLAAIS